MFFFSVWGKLAFSNYGAKFTIGYCKYYAYGYYELVYIFRVGFSAHGSQDMLIFIQGLYGSNRGANSSLLSLIGTACIPLECLSINSISTIY